MHPILAFIGGGNMAGSLIGGLRAKGWPAQRLRVAEPDAARRAALHDAHGVTVAARAADVVHGADAVVLAVKPQQVAEALSGLALDAGCTLVSIAAGLRLDSLRQLAGAQVHLVRSMPNTPALVGQGISGLCAPAGTPDAARALAERILSAAGPCVWVADEAQMDAVTALSGSGPAYYFLLTEVLAASGARLGLDAATSAALARQTFIGAARMAEQRPEDMATLRAQVTSKGGTTEAACQLLIAGGVQSLYNTALAAAEQRGRELGDALAKTL